MSLKYAKYFETDPEYGRLAAEKGMALKETNEPLPPFDVEADRKAVTADEQEWSAANPVKDAGQEVRIEQVQVRDGAKIDIAIYRPIHADPSAKLPLFFDIHGGGFALASHVVEERWLLRPLFETFDFVTISVDYRLAPEHQFPGQIDDCWDALQNVISRSEELGFDRNRIIIGGSSAGGCTATCLAHLARDAKLPLLGIVCNVPITCDPRHFPKDEYEYSSYEQCFGTTLSSGEMWQLWEKILPDEQAGKDGSISPLLADVKGLAPHVIFIGGQDPLRDEAIAYADKLKKNGVKTTMHIYQGVPHDFAWFWEIKITQKFWEDLKSAVKGFLEQ